MTQVLAGAAGGLIALLGVLLDYGAARHQLAQALRAELGRPALSDDEAGHDVPDIDNPRSTHTPNGPRS
jgi:hypothetical protein